MSEYERRFTVDQGGGSPIAEFTTVNNLYYDLVTDFFELGWGRSFHFAPRVPGESFKASLARHEHYLAHRLGLGPGMVVADLGCGVGGPLMEIARFTGAKIVGVNSNGYQLDRARKLLDDAGLAHLADFLHCDFLRRGCSRRVIRRGVLHRGHVLRPGQGQHLSRGIPPVEAGRRASVPMSTA